MKNVMKGILYRLDRDKKISIQNNLTRDEICENGDLFNIRVKND